MNKKGFTLIELIIVVIIIGILATLAVPQFLKATERAKIAKAKNSMGIIAKAQKMYYAVPVAEGGGQDNYIAFGAGGADAALGKFIELAETDTDTDWTYSSTGGPAAFTITAQRSSGSIAGCLITLTNTGVWADACSTAL